MITLETVIVALIVLGSAVVTGRWLWRSLHPAAEGPACSSCIHAKSDCDACTLPEPHEEEKP